MAGSEDALPRLCSFPWMLLGSEERWREYLKRASREVRDWDRRNREVSKRQLHAKGIRLYSPPRKADAPSKVVAKIRYAGLRIRRGECLSGLLGDHWREIYQLNANSEFRRQNPRPDVIRPGTVIYVPVAYDDADPQIRAAWTNEPVKARVPAIAAKNGPVPRQAKGKAVRPSKAAASTRSQGRATVRQNRWRELKGSMVWTQPLVLKPCAHPVSIVKSELKYSIKVSPALDRTFLVKSGTTMKRVDSTPVTLSNEDLVFEAGGQKFTVNRLGQWSVATPGGNSRPLYSVDHSGRVQGVVDLGKAEAANRDLKVTSQSKFSTSGTSVTSTISNTFTTWVRDEAGNVIMASTITHTQSIQIDAALSLLQVLVCEPVRPPRPVRVPQQRWSPSRPIKPVGQTEVGYWLNIGVGIALSFTAAGLVLRGAQAARGLVGARNAATGLGAL